MGEMGSTIFLVGKPEGKRPLGISTWEDNIRMDIWERRW
jgi:hypothetical protein